MSAERLDVAHMLKRPFRDLSGGQCQRAMIAMALASEPDCLLLDEPITGLDLSSQQIILDVIKAERAAGRLVVLSTHHLHEACCCDRVLLLQGSVVADGDPDDVLSCSAFSEVFGACGSAAG